MKKLDGILSPGFTGAPLTPAFKRAPSELDGLDSYMGLIKTIDDVKALFPQSVQEIEQMTLQAIEEAKERLHVIISMPADQRTCSNTFGALDETVARFIPVGNALETLKMVSTSADIRTAANTALVMLKDFSVDYFSQNNDLYKVCKEYVESANKEVLNDEEKFYIEKVMKGFTYAGLHLSAERQAKIKALNKQLIPLEEQFMDNISADQPFIKVSRAELAGLDDMFIESLPRADELYILSTDYPTVVPVLENCTVESTRRNLWKIYVNRAYPQNSILLKQIIELRDELATTLGFESYAHLNLDDLMAKNPETVDAFLDDIITKSQPKVKQEIDLLLASLPAGLSITDNGKIFPWDMSFIKGSYKKKHLNVDERTIAEYFPLEHTLDQLLSIYEQFMGISFQPIQASGFWHEEVKAMAVYNARRDVLLGYLLLDLFPRPFKYTHACEIDIIKAHKTADKHYPAVAVVLANFSRPTANQPALLQRNQVQTFFHEFGHALHEVLGVTQFAGLAGTSVKRDFVETPSQMLEEWLWDKDVLKKVSKHYRTGESLPDDLIERIRALKTFDAGDWIQRQAFLSKLSLYYFKARIKKSLYDIHQELHKEIRHHIAWESEDHFEASFGHLIGYGPGYYSYPWAKVFALDLAATIRQFGFMNQDIGKRYVDEILSKGGSVEPDILLKNFLGRAPNSDAFFRDMGI